MDPQIPASSTVETVEAPKPKTPEELQREAVETYLKLCNTDKAAAKQLHATNPFIRQTFSAAGHS